MKLKSLILLLGAILSLNAIAGQLSYSGKDSQEPPLAVPSKSFHVTVNTLDLSQSTKLSEIQLKDSVCPEVKFGIASYHQAYLSSAASEITPQSHVIFGFTKNGLLHRDFVFVFERDSLSKASTDGCHPTEILERWKQDIRMISSQSTLDQASIHLLPRNTVNQDLFKIERMQSGQLVINLNLVTKTCSAGFLLVPVGNIAPNTPVGFFKCSERINVIQLFDALTQKDVAVVEVKKLEEGVTDGKGAGGFLVY